MKTAIKYLIIAVLGFGLTMPQAALAQRSRVRIGGGQSSSKPKPKPKPDSKPRSNQKPAPAPTPADQTFTVKRVAFTLIGVQGGTFTMGATAEQGSRAENDEKPAHRVTLSSFCIGKTEVTQELWEAVMGSNPSFCRGTKIPVGMVSWNDCQEFITRLNQMTGLNFRLPTEAEWEFAARGGNKSQGYEYSGDFLIDFVAWYEENSIDRSITLTKVFKPQDVATKRPNELGLYDMSGNVREWCQDWYGNYSSVAQTNPTGPTSGSGRVERGGGWGSYANDCRVSCRKSNNPDYRDSDLGFRLAL